MSTDFRVDAPYHQAFKNGRIDPEFVAYFYKGGDNGLVFGGTIINPDSLIAPIVPNEMIEFETAYLNKLYRKEARYLVFISEADYDELAAAEQAGWNEAEELGIDIDGDATAVNTFWVEWGEILDGTPVDFDAFW